MRAFVERFFEVIDFVLKYSCRQLIDPCGDNIVETFNQATEDLIGSTNWLKTQIKE